MSTTAHDGRSQHEGSNVEFDSQRRDPHRQVLMEALHGRLPQGVAVFDLDLRLVYANPRWSVFLEHATAGSREPSLGTRFTDLLPGADDLCAAALDCTRTGKTVHLPGWRASTQAGETFWDITLAPLSTEQRVSGVICVVDDTTARVLAEHAAAAKVRLAAFRADVSQALAGSDEIDAVLQSCAEVMVRHASAAFARIWVLDEAEDIYRLRASAGLYTRLNGTYSRIPTAWLHPEDGRFLASKPGVAIDLLRTHHVLDPDWATEQGLVSWASHPLIARGHLVGFMVMFARQNFDEDTLSELAAIADAIAQFVQRKHAEAALREAHERATFQERQRLARELHDSVAQTLFGIRLTAQAARTLLDREPMQAAAPLDSVLSLAEGGIAETRALVFALRPDALATEGLVAALDRQVQALRARHELNVQTALEAEPDAPLEVKEALYRIAQEALHNTVKHARATRVGVRLIQEPAAVVLELTDNGVGFDPTQDFPGHLGQTSMRERAEQLAGTLNVRSAPGEGTRITARIPLLPAS